MGNNSRCVIGICDNGMRCPELHKKHSNVHGDMIMHKFKIDGSVKTLWINAIIKVRKPVIQDSFYTFMTTSLFG